MRICVSKYSFYWKPTSQSYNIEAFDSYPFVPAYMRQGRQWTTLDGWIRIRILSDRRCPLADKQLAEVFLSVLGRPTAPISLSTTYDTKFLKFRIEIIYPT